MKQLQIRPVPGTSFVHRLRPDAKIIAIASIATASVFRPEWPVIGLGWLVVILVFAASRLPRNVLAPPPRMFFLVTGFGAMFNLFAGGDPVVAGFGLGGLLDFAQLVSVSLLVIAMAAVLAWTTPLSDIGLGLARLLRPLRVLRLPVDEFATVLMLAVRSLPMVISEVQVTVDARSARPGPTTQSTAAVFRDAADFGATVVTGTHRRAREMAKAMAARGSLTAPAQIDGRWRLTDWLVAIVFVAAAVAIVVVF